MIVQSFKKNKKRYELIIDGNFYSFDEEVIIKYRLVLNKEIDEITLNKAIKYNENINYYIKTIDYVIKYGKSQAAVYDYLASKGLDNQTIAEIISNLKTKGIINDSKLIDSIIDSLIRKHNGLLLIEKKLIEKKFNKDMISMKLNNIDYDYYYEKLNELYSKIKSKYSNDYNSQIKLKKYLLSRGYTYDDISNLV